MSEDLAFLPKGNMEVIMSLVEPEIHVKQCDITTLDCDAIVNAAKNKAAFSFSIIVETYSGGI